MSLRIPAKITIVGSRYYLDGGTVALLAITDEGNECTIQLNQSVFAGGDDPGRLLFNNELIEVRSAEEHQIVALLETAEIELEEEEESEGSSEIVDVEESGNVSRHGWHSICRILGLALNRLCRLGVVRAVLLRLHLVFLAPSQYSIGHVWDNLKIQR